MLYPHLHESKGSHQPIHYLRYTIIVFYFNAADQSAELERCLLYCSGNRKVINIGTDYRTFVTVKNGIDFMFDMIAHRSLLKLFPNGLLFDTSVDALKRD